MSDENTLESDERKVDYRLRAHQWLLANSWRSILTLADIKAYSGENVPSGSVAYVNGVSGGDEGIKQVTFRTGSRSGAVIFPLTVADLESESFSTWNLGDGKTQIVPISLLKDCMDLCSAAFEAEGLEARQDFLTSLYANLSKAVGQKQVDANNPIVRASEQRWNKHLYGSK